VFLFAAADLEPTVWCHLVDQSLLMSQPYDKRIFRLERRTRVTLCYVLVRNL
jgi:hypothetical protein